MKKTAGIVLALAVSLMNLGDAHGQNHRATNPEMVNQFGGKLYNRLSATEGNIFFSPYSIHAALSMTLLGARGQTATEMAEVLAVDNGQLAASGHAHLATTLKAASEQGGFELNIANSLWGEQTVNFIPAFTQDIQRQFGSELHRVNFRQNPPQAQKQINNWVDSQTQGKITNLIPDGVLTIDTTLVLVNAIYFKSAWMAQFDPKATTDGEFYLADGTTTPARMMNRKGDYLYARTDQVQIIELPYQGGELSMLIALPHERDDIASAERLLTDGFADASNLLQMRNVQLTLPRWEMRFQLDLGQQLKDMGMGRAFSNGADFSGMTTDEQLAISNVIHEAFVAVDEYGTEAAAATAVVIARMSLPLEEDIVTMRVDHPFVFAIRERSSGAILFGGRVMTVAK